MVFSERPGAVKGVPSGAAQRTLDGEDRSETVGEQGKQGCRLKSISESAKSETVAICVWQP
jgi:hypothetical protein